MTKHWELLTAEEAKQHPLYGVGGWLWWLAFSLIFSFSQDLIAVNSVRLEFGMPISQFLSSNWSGVSFIKIGLLIGLLKVTAIYTLLFLKHPRFRQVSTYIMVGHLPALLLVGILTHFPALRQFFSVQTTMQWLISCAVWITYLQKSKRVRVTFEHTVEVAQGKIASIQFAKSVQSNSRMSARTERGWRWFKLVAIVILASSGASLGVKMLFAPGRINSFNTVGTTLVAGVGGIIVFGGIAFLLGWLTGGNERRQTAAMPPVTTSATVPDASVMDATYERIDQELKADNLDRATWTRAQGDAGGNAERAKSLYIKYRAQRLLAASRDQRAHQSAVDAVSAKQLAKRNISRFVADNAAFLVCAVFALIVAGYYVSQNSTPLLPELATYGTSIQRPTGVGQAPGKSVDWSQFTPVQPLQKPDLRVPGDTLVPQTGGLPPSTYTPTPVYGDPFHRTQQEEILDHDVPDWRAIVGPEGDTSNKYRMWLSKQPPKYQQEVLSTFNSAAVVERSIAKFKAETEKTAPGFFNPADDRAPVKP
jgi:Protein of unknown function (DUF2569)